MPQTKLIETSAAQDFLKTVYMLQTQSDRVSTHRLAEVLSISAPSVSDMAARLSADGLIDYRKYYGVRLTEAGASIAQAVVRRHERIEQFLVHDLGYTADEAHCEAASYWQPHPARRDTVYFPLFSFGAVLSRLDRCASQQWQPTKSHAVDALNPVWKDALSLP